MTDLHLPLDRSAGRLAAQIAAGFRSAVRSGRLTAGTRLPSSRDLARDLDVSRGVVVAAYEQLTAEGFLVARRGDGTRIAPLARPDDEPEPASAPGGSPRPDPAPAYDLWPSLPDLASFPRDRWIAAARTALRTLPHDALTYPDPGGVHALRAELSGYLARVRAAHTDPARIVIMNGVAHGLSALLRLLRADGHTALAVEDPTSDRQQPMLDASGLRTVRVPVDAEGVDVEALARTRARAVLVTPAHQYPTGVVLSAARRAELIAWARDVDGLILEDDYDAEFRYDREPVGCLQGVEPDRVVLLGSVSKSLAPALRLGWAVAPPALAQRLREHRENTDLGTPVLDQHALAEFLRGGGYDRHLRSMRRRYRYRRDALAKALDVHLPNAMVHGVSAGIHLYVELPAGLDENEVVARAARAGVAVAGARPMWSPARAGDAPPALVLGYARLTETHLVKAAELLGQAVTHGAEG
ncbi:MocR-like pyridoxine biosynthesis transcription factor PdxR [Actinomadura livida]|uniref:GntR family transcriptional regulator/MocR family aminotransferase n=1 Tax=Actinomadura livida TaxID=79909 RepID=A0A7W7IAP9_9ACTN|nr:MULTISPECIES: PLP-dependent aminotransferase family protein [Actinomadura]MBB4773253.1 GntR family transcriptional regulator/MocR family aminotransferase [Actinomadura catellatispora]GGU19145.1 GntR family transcriptional regulator [Actinomadura livida]